MKGGYKNVPKKSATETIFIVKISLQIKSKDSAAKLSKKVNKVWCKISSHI